MITSRTASASKSSTHRREQIYLLWEAGTLIFIFNTWYRAKSLFFFQLWSSYQSILSTVTHEERTIYCLWCSNCPGTYYIGYCYFPEEFPQIECTFIWLLDGQKMWCICCIFPTWSPGCTFRGCCITLEKWNSGRFDVRKLRVRYKYGSISRALL